MIQIIGLLLCIYLVFKGWEIFHIGQASSRTDTSFMMQGLAALIASIVIAAIFAVLLLASTPPR